MAVPRRNEGCSCGIELIRTGIAVTGSKTGILELRTGLYIEPLPACLKIDIRQLEVGILECFGFFGVGFRGKIAVATRVLDSRVNACVIAFPSTYE